MEERVTLPENIKAEVEKITSSINGFIENLVKNYEERIAELETKCEELEQENIELKYKLRQLSNDLKNLSERIASEFLKRAESAFQEVSESNRQSE